MPDRIRIIGIYDNPAFSAPIEYTFDLLFSVYGVKYRIVPLNEFKPAEYDLNEVLAVTYGRQCPERGFKKQIHIHASGFFGENYLKPPSMPHTPLKKYDGLPVIYAGSDRLDGFVKSAENGVETGIDIIASSFFMVSRYEEVIVDARDKYDRFPASASLAYREGFLDRPLVNEYIELLWGWIQALAPDLRRRPLWPQNKDFAFCLTHDVDSVRRYSFIPPVFRMGGAILKKRSPRLAMKILMQYLASLLNKKSDPHNTFDYLLNIERTHNLKSSFYFMSSGDSYKIDEPGIVNLIRQIQDSGGEAGLHGSYFSYNDMEIMAAEKAKLDKVISHRSYGCRQHFLRWKTPETWRIQEKTGILYDTTLTYADHAGFRCGICLPFKPFDVLENRPMNIWELPLTIMEGSLQNPNYQNLPPEAAYDEMIRLGDVVKKFGGVFVLLWHNSSFYPLGGWEGWKEIYERFLEYLSRQNVFTGTGRELINYWQDIAKY